MIIDIALGIVLAVVILVTGVLVIGFILDKVGNRMFRREENDG